jgi:hypothetical protein
LVLPSQLKYNDTKKGKEKIEKPFEKYKIGH